MLFVPQGRSRALTVSAKLFAVSEKAIMMLHFKLKFILLKLPD